ncbi:hypothetical protein NPIL_236891 [Nephila pilipes]|uniref:Uncharacterized protein n=1 Tax=Nephila pilipes TaxID=299642 RepID=A0A8X6TZY7_NEPPI|nr:hypothetical protein NPIL_236891 [Nephila pilipes]
MVLNEFGNVEVGPKGTGLTNLDTINNQVDATFKNLDESLKDDLDENFTKSFEKLKNFFLFLASPCLNAVVDDLESAVSLVYPNHTNKRVTW